MIANLSPIPLPGAPPALNAPPAAGGGEVSLCAFLDLLAPAADAVPVPTAGQPAAGHGKPLPVATEAEGIDPAFAWLGLGPLPAIEPRPPAFTPPATTAVRAGLSGMASPIAIVAAAQAQPALETGISTPIALVSPVATQPTLPQPADFALVGRGPAPLAMPEPVPALFGTLPATPLDQAAIDPAIRFDAPVPARTVASHGLPSAPRPDTPGAMAPALSPPVPPPLAFAEAIAAARAGDRRDTIETPLPAAPAATAVQTIAAVVATAQSDDAALDMRREDWPAAMIHRIELLRDAADANDTSIRLIPDALGSIDVSLRREGDRVEVRFAAEQPQTRQLLADAAPRLQELAEQRGVRLGSGPSDGSGQQNAQHQPRQTHSRPPPAPAARPGAGVDDDERIA